MKLGELATVLHSVATLPPDWFAREIRDIVHDSRKVRPGSLFVAVRGYHSDGHQFISQALQQGAAAIVAEKREGIPVSADTPMILIENSRRALALLANAFYREPSHRLKLIGITGTKGKTTTSYLVRSIIEAAGRVTGLIGTIDYRVGSTIYPAPNTTPESLELQKLLGEMVDAGAGYCVMEVSSHALALGRTEGCVFETAVLTNLQQDHLDFHGDLRSYFEAKRMLFTGLTPDKTAVVNGDDAAAGEIMENTRARVCTYGLTTRSNIHPREIIGHGIGGLVFSVRTPDGEIAVESPLVGKHNVYNILAAIGAGLSLGFDRESIARGIRNMKAVPGRMEKIDEGQPFGVVVDYAHTEDSLRALLEAVREVAKGRLIVLFGCGGDRDRTKRPKMGAAAIAGSDMVIVTSDNPRTEDPIAIIREIEGGMIAGIRVRDLVSTRGGNEDIRSRSAAAAKPYAVIPDRAEAIRTAIGMACPGDVVVLAGKGHEDYQIIGDSKIHFDDREVAREAIRQRQMTGVR